MLHGIFFHRLFGVVKPAKIDCLDVSFPAVKDSETEKLVDDTVLRFLRELQSVRHSKKEGQIEVFFAEKKAKKATWFNSGGEVCITLCLFSMLTFV
jgi:autophagy-related protein 101